MYSVNLASSALHMRNVCSSLRSKAPSPLPRSRTIVITRASDSNGNSHHKGSTDPGSHAATPADVNIAEERKEFERNYRPSVRNNPPYLTTNSGNPVYDNMWSLKAGSKGPTLLEDLHLLEKMQSLNREKAPERIVHARGMSAKGFFEVTDDVTDVCKSHFLGEVGRRTPLIARFSTVSHEKGSPESLRDVRGFSVKMYTQEGNWDFVGNATPVFFIRDSMQFPDLVHALRPNPKNHIQEGWRILDFLAHHPESCHTLLYLQDDVGIYKNWRHLEGHSVNAFKVINSNGDEQLVKFRWLPQAGVETMDDDEAVQAGELNMRHSHATHDLYNSIYEGNFPRYDLYMQLIKPNPDVLGNLSFEPLDCTQIWPEDEVPLRKVGTMTLDTNIDNFHNENDSLAFSPGVIPPGITFSNDPVLQGRVFSYGDAQRYRIGTNYQLLPVNVPRCPFHINETDGAMNFAFRDEEVNYYPSMAVEKQGEYTGADVGAAPNWPREPVNGMPIKTGVWDKDTSKLDNVYRQAGDRWRSFDALRKARFVKRMSLWMTDPKCPPMVRDTWLQIWRRCDEGLATALQAAVSAKGPLDYVKERTAGRDHGASKA